MIKKSLNRRDILRGAGVALALPWLEAYAPKSSRAQAAPGITRYFSCYFPNGTPDFWRPSGSGANWQLSPILEPLGPVKEYVTVLGNVGNYSPFGGHIEPSHGHNCASAWTGVKAFGDGSNANGISIDQVIADQMVAANGGALVTPLHSLQVGVSTIDGSPDGIPPQHSHSISWNAANEPLYKIVSPQGVFDRIVGDSLPSGGNTDATPDPLAERRRALKQSALDYVIENATDIQTKVSYSDRQKLEQFLGSVRALEMRAGDPTMPGAGLTCNPMARPSEVFGVGNTPAGYNRGDHATLITDLVVMAVECDVTRVFTYMLDDARSEFVYNFYPMREFSATGSTPGNGTCGNYHGAQHGGANDFGSISYFIVEKMSELAQKLAAIPEGDSNVLANSHITFGSGMNGGNHDGLNLPMCLIGGGGGKVKTNQFIDFGSETNLADIHLTIAQGVFGSPITQFGEPQGGYTSGPVPEILV